MLCEQELTDASSIFYVAVEALAKRRFDLRTRKFTYVNTSAVVVNARTMAVVAVVPSYYSIITGSWFRRERKEGAPGCPSCYLNDSVVLGEHAPSCLSQGDRSRRHGPPRIGKRLGRLFLAGRSGHEHIQRHHHRYFHPLGTCVA